MDRWGNRRVPGDQRVVRVKTNTHRPRCRERWDAEHIRPVTQLLEHHGFHVTSINMDEWRNGHRPDLVARHGKEIFTIALWDRTFLEETACVTFDPLASPGSATEAKRRARDAATTATALRAAQFKVLPTRAYRGPEPFHLGWIQFEGENADREFDAARARLYGTVPIADCSLVVEPRAEGLLPEARTRCRQCYYFVEGAFARHRDALDAVLLSRPSRLMLCLNSLSSKATRFRASSMARAFSGSLVDPDRWEKSRIAYVLDAQVDRTDQPACLEHLRQKYHTGPLIALAEAPARCQSGLWHSPLLK